MNTCHHQHLDRRLGGLRRTRSTKLRVFSALTMVVAFALCPTLELLLTPSSRSAALEQARMTFLKPE